MRAPRHERTSARIPPALVALLAAAACVPAEVPAPPLPRSGPPPPGFPSEIVDAQNAVRAAASPTPTPPLPAFSWGPTVAATAAAWASGCTYAHNPDVHALYLGENIAATRPVGAYSATEVVGLWASEAPFYDLATNTCDETDPANEAHTCGHYTQLVWRDTLVVGCAVTTCSTGSPFGGGTWEFWVCDYAPPGNWIGQRPY